MAESGLEITTLWQCMILKQGWAVHRTDFQICPRLLMERAQEMNMSFNYELQRTGRFYDGKR
ncbi:hypothetical protein ACFLZE_01535 [Thermodesulfobacteriota bacterium]